MREFMAFSSIPVFALFGFQIESLASLSFAALINDTADRGGTGTDRDTYCCKHHLRELWELSALQNMPAFIARKFGNILVSQRVHCPNYIIF